MRIYEFVREHVIPFNSVIAMSVTVAVVLDFLAPQAPYLAWVSYVLAALVLLAMVLEVRALRQGTADKAWYGRLLARLRPPPGPLWKSPAWQVIGIIAVIALALGQSSKAKADSGGLIASAAPNLRNVQVLLLGLQEDTRRIRDTLNSVDVKVDDIHASVQESNQKISALDAHVGLLKKEVSDDPRKELVARGYTVDADGLIAAIRQKDGIAIGSFNASGYSYRAPSVLDMNNHHVKEQYLDLMRMLFDDVDFSRKVDPKILGIPLDDGRFCKAAVEYLDDWAYGVMSYNEGSLPARSQALVNMLGLTAHYCTRDKVLFYIEGQKKEARKKRADFKELKELTGIENDGEKIFATQTKALEWMLKNIP